MTVERIERLETRVAKMELNAGISTVQYDNINKRLFSIEDTMKWLVRLVLGGLIMLLLGFIASGGISVG